MLIRQAHLLNPNICYIQISDLCFSFLLHEELVYLMILAIYKDKINVYKHTLHLIKLPE